MKKKTPIERFLALSDVQKDAEVARFEREIPLSETRPLNAAQRKQWRRIKRKMGRPVIGEGAKTIAITVERGLLRRADRYAKQHDLKRAELIARGLELVLRRKTG
jgi:hypothetical protein